MDQNNVYELAKTLQQTDGLQKDFLQMMSSLKETVEKNYIQKIHLAAGTQKSLAVEHPPKEVTLLRALAPFLDPQGQGRIQEMTQSMLMLHSLQNIRQGVETIAQDGAMLAARSSDGCNESLNPGMAQMAGVLLALALTEQF